MYILTVTERDGGKIAHQEVFTEPPAFPLSTCGYSVWNYRIEVREANANGGDSTLRELFALAGTH